MNTSIRQLTKAEIAEIKSLNGNWKPNFKDMNQYKFYPTVNGIEVPSDFAFKTVETAKKAGEAICRMLNWIDID